MDLAHEVLATLWLFTPAFAANMAPVLVKGHLEWMAGPVDGGRLLRGRRLLGDHKTWRGIVVGIVAGALVYELQRALDQLPALHALARIDYASWPLLPGILLGAGTGTGDAVKSLFKRQLDIAPGGSWLVFDQLDFLFGSWLFLLPVVEAPLLPLLATTPIVFVGGLVTSAIGHRAGLKDQWP